jgi:hypothetical protein
VKLFGMMNSHHVSCDLIIIYDVNDVFLCFEHSDPKLEKIC